MRRDDRIRLQHMLDSARDAQSFVTGRSRQDLDRERLLVLALVKAIEIIGEATYQVTEDTRVKLPDISWVDIVGMCHRLVHAYFDINLDILWRTVQEDLPPIIAQLEAALQKKGNG